MAGSPRKRAKREGAGLPVAPKNPNPGHGGEKRGYSWKNAEPGNELAITHGSYVSPLRLGEDERTAELADAIRETQPVYDASDEAAIWRLAMVYRRLELSKQALDKADAALSHPLAGYSDAASFLEKLRNDHRGWLREAGRIENELGRTPRSRAALGLAIASTKRQISLADLHEQAALEAAEDAELVDERDDDV